jgi:hypothetical protein
MIKIKLGDLLVADQTLQALGDIDLPARAAYDVAKMAKVIAPDVQIFNDKRNALVKELGEDREPTEAERANGATSSITAVKAENLDEYNRRVQELLDLDIEINLVGLDLSRFGDKFMLKPRQIFSLGALVKDYQD